MKTYLCFIRGNKAYFTTIPLQQQWGDDWDDAPYEHNAGGPYRQEELGVGHRVYVLYFSHLLYRTPADLHFPNSPFSVEQINQCVTPWLWPGDNRVEHYPPIWAGCSIEKFTDRIQSTGGDVLPMGEI